MYTKTFENLVQGLVPPALICIYPRSWSLIALRSPRNTRFEDVVSILNATLKLAVSSTFSNKVLRFALSKALSFYLVKPTNRYWLRVWGWHLMSVHFRKTGARISFLPKLWYFLFWFVLKVPQFWKKRDSRNCLLKMNGL